MNFYGLERNVGNGSFWGQMNIFRTSRHTVLLWAGTDWLLPAEMLCAHNTWWQARLCVGDYPTLLITPHRTLHYCGYTGGLLTELPLVFLHRTVLSIWDQSPGVWTKPKDSCAYPSSPQLLIWVLALFKPLKEEILLS